MHIKDHSAAMKFFRTYDSAASKGKWKEFVDEMEFDSMLQEPRTMAQEPRIGLQGGQLVQNTADGSRPGYKGEKQIKLTTDMVTQVAEKNPNWKAADILEHFNKDKSINYVTSRGSSINRDQIQKTLSTYYDLTAETKAKIPKNYSISTEVFENLPISKKDYFRVRDAKEGGTLLTKEIDELLKPVKIVETFYFKKPSKRDMKSFNRLADKTGRLNNRIADLMIDFDTAYRDEFFSKGNVPDIKDVAKKFKITDSTAGKVTSRLAQWYGGQDFKNPQLQDLKRNKVTSNRMFKTIEKSSWGNPYRDGLYQISMQTIDAKLGNKQGTFEKFKSQAKQILKDNKIPIYDPKMGKNAFGFNVNEIAGVTGSAKSKAAEFSQFVDIMEGNINTKTMAGFQSKLSTARVNIEKAKGTKNYKSVLSSESKRINDMAIRLEKQHGMDLPRLRDPDATKYFSTSRIKQLEAQGLDIVKAAERAGYTIEMPKGAKTIGEFTSEVKNLNKVDTMKLLKKMGYRCRKAAGAGEDVACYMEDVKKTRADMKNPNLKIKNAALAKQRKAFDIGKKVKSIGKMFRRGVQGTLGVIGMNNPLGWAIEGIIEGGIYDYYKRQGYSDDQAFAETFTPRLAKEALEGKSTEDVPWYGGAEELIEQEKIGTRWDPSGKVNVAAKYVDAKSKYDEAVEKYYEIQDNRPGNLEQAEALQAELAEQAKIIVALEPSIKAGTPEYEAYQQAEETQTALMDERRREYLEKVEPGFLEREQESFDPYVRDKEGKILYKKMSSSFKKREKETEEWKEGKDAFTIKPGEYIDWAAYGLDDDEGIKAKWKQIYEHGGMDLLDRIGIAGGVSKMAEGGIAGLMKKYYD